MIIIKSFEIQDTIFNAFTQDTLMLSLMNVLDVNDYEELNAKFRREQQDSTLVTSEVVPFVSFVFIDASPTKNHLANKGLLELEIYAPNRYTAMQIYSRANDVLKNTFDIQIVAEGQKFSGVQNIYYYVVRYKPIINS